MARVWLTMTFDLSVSPPTSAGISTSKEKILATREEMGAMEMMGEWALLMSLETTTAGRIF